MKTCPNCKKEVKWYEGFGNTLDRSGRYCSFKCFREYKFTPLKTSSDRSPQMKKVILEELKKEEIKRQTEFELNGSKPTQRDLKRQEKIKELERELQPSAGGILAGGGLIGGMALSMTGVSMMVIGGILILTIIGAPIGIVLFVLGLILLILSGIFALLGVGSGATVGIIGYISKIMMRPKKKR